MSIEFIDDTREVLLVQEVDKSYSNTVVNYRIVNVYKTNVLIYPNYEVLISKPIRRIVIQRTNGKVWIIETKAKRAKKLLVEFKKVCQKHILPTKIRLQMITILTSKLNELLKNAITSKSL